MRRDGSQVWRRCRTCGSIFSDAKELRSHLELHDTAKRLTLRVGEEDRENSAGDPAEDRDLVQDGELLHLRGVR